jgi:hypothetical protein
MGFLVAKLLALVLSSAGCISVATWRLGDRGLRGAALGAGLGIVMCVINHLLLRWVRRTKGNAMYFAMLASMVVSFGLMISGVVVLLYLERGLVEPAAFTALIVYVAFRLLDSVEASGFAARSGKPGVGRGGTVCLRPADPRPVDDAREGGPRG